MLPFEKFILDTGGEKNFPVPTEKGFLAYQTKKEKIKQINFLFFYLDSAKNSLNNYTFKFTTINLVPGNKKEKMITNAIEVDWEKFFYSIKEAKDKIAASSEFSICKSIDEADFLIWKSYVVLNDEWFSEIYNQLPLSFFESIDESNDLKKIQENKRVFLSYLKENYHDFYGDWLRYFPIEHCDYFCDWFYNYFYQF